MGKYSFFYRISGNSIIILFLHLCSYNMNYDLLVISDCDDDDSSVNVRVMKSPLSKVKDIAEKRSGFRVSLDSPYKLCNFKSA